MSHSQKINKTRYSLKEKYFLMNGMYLQFKIIQIKTLKKFIM